MSNNTPVKQQQSRQVGLSQMSVKQLFSSETVIKKFEKVLGDNAQAFVSSVLQAISDNKMLQEADSMTVINAAMKAATLDLPINPNLGFAYIVPYRNKGVVEAQFQMGYKGFIQLCYRSGQVKTISSTPVYEGELKQRDRLKGFEFDWEGRQSDTIIGYAAYIEYINGGHKTMYSSVDEIKTHAQKFSQSYGKGYSPWSDHFDAMAEKTVLKKLLSTYGMMSTKIQDQQLADATLADGAVIRDTDGGYDYPEKTEVQAEEVSFDEETGEIHEEDPQPEPKKQDKPAPKKKTEDKAGNEPATPKDASSFNFDDESFEGTPFE